MQKLAVVGVVIVAALLLASAFTGLIPGLSILGDEGFETQSKWYECYQGNPDKELLLPEDRKGFITSYRSDLEFGLSETIVVAGNYNAQTGWQQIHKYRYVIKWKANPSAEWNFGGIAGAVGNFPEGVLFLNLMHILFPLAGTIPAYIIKWIIY